jgi:hypothetical protein
MGTSTKHQSPFVVDVELSHSRSRSNPAALYSRRDDNDSTFNHESSVILYANAVLDRLAYRVDETQTPLSYVHRYNRRKQTAAFGPISDPWAPLGLLRLSTRHDALAGSRSGWLAQKAGGCTFAVGSCAFYLRHFLAEGHEIKLEPPAVQLGRSLRTGQLALRSCEFRGMEIVTRRSLEK